MREDEKRDCFQAAIDQLADEAVANANPNHPGAYRATVRSNLATRHRIQARDLFAEHGELTPDELAVMLATTDLPTHAAKQPMRMAKRQRRDGCHTCGAYEGGGWLGGDRMDDGTLPDAMPCPSCAVDRHRETQRHLNGANR